MAQYRGHLIGGITAGTIVAAVFYSFGNSDGPSSAAFLNDWQFGAGIIVVAALFGLWPDVDINSKAQNLFYGVALSLNILLIALGFFVASSVLGLLAMTPIVGKHRGWTHSKIAAFVVPLPIIALPSLASQNLESDNFWVLYASAVAGYLSHLLLDGRLIKSIRIRGGWK